MIPGTRSHGRAFVAALVLPAAFASTWAWLEHGGAIERARAAEQAAATQALETAVQSLLDGLQRAADEAMFPMPLAPDGRVLAPFRGPGQLAAPPVSVAEQAAGARTAAGDVAAAMPFYAHAAADGTLTPEGWLAYADLLASSDRARAEAALAAAAVQHAEASCGNLPFALLAAMRRAHWASVAGAPTDALADAMLAAARRVPATAVDAVASAIEDTLPQLRADARLAELRAAATAAIQYGATSAPTTIAPGPYGSVLVPRADRTLAVVPAPRREQLRATAWHAASLAQPTLAIARAEPDAPAATVRAVDALGETWSTVPVTTPTSLLLTATARTCLGLALGTLVFGNLLLWRLTRREHALVRLRADFVDIVSHELRTPLAALSLKAEMLAAGDVPAHRRGHYLEALHGDVRRLVDQVERILDFGRLQRGAPLRAESIPARALLARGLRAGRAALRLVGQDLEVEAPRSLPSLTGDVEVLSRALRNLLENAAKYAPAGSTVAVRAFAEHGQLVVEVADRGPGVPATERRAIFEPFVRGPSASSAVPGSGLGLALVAAAAKAHGGSVQVHDRPGGGAVFVLSLPIASAEVAS